MSREGRQTQGLALVGAPIIGWRGVSFSSLSIGQPRCRSRSMVHHLAFLGFVERAQAFDQGVADRAAPQFGRFWRVWWSSVLLLVNRLGM